MEWIYTSLAEASETTGIVRTMLMRWIRAGRVKASRHSRGPEGGRPALHIAHSEIAATAAELGWWKDLPDPWELKRIREEKAQQQAKLDAFTRAARRS